MLFEAWCLETACLLEVHDTLGDGFLTEARPALMLLRKHLPVSLDQTGLGACSVQLMGTGQSWRRLWLSEHRLTSSVLALSEPGKQAV